MEIRLIEESERDLAYWQNTHNSIILRRISELFASMEANPTTGIGKPEPLRHGLSGYWQDELTRQIELYIKLRKI